MTIDLHLLTGAYAVDALDLDEKAAFEAHLPQCPSCTAELVELREAAHLLADLAPLAPPPSLKASLMDAISQTRQLPPVVPPEGPAEVPAELPLQHSVASPHDVPAATPVTPVTPLASRRRRWIPGALLVAAAAVLVAVGVAQPWESSTPVTGVDQIIAAADAQQMEQVMDSGASVTVYVSPDLGKAAMVAHDLPNPGAGKVYAVWLQDDDGAMIPAGLVPESGSGAMVLDGSAAHATAAGVTIEPAGGSAAPTSDPVMLFEFDETQG